jgi:hypothetical protein
MGDDDDVVVVAAVILCCMGLVMVPGTCQIMTP